MEQRNYLKILWLLAFVAFAAVSCWATTESLHLLLSTWPKLMCWIVTIGFFVIASLGTKMIVDSLNTNIYLEHRGLHLAGGILIVLVFWLVCSMPTNTHTFFYRTVIGDKVSTDISMTRGYLEQIKSNTNNVNQAKVKVQELNNAVEVKLGELEAEIKNEANPGFGPQSKEIFRAFASLLDVDKIDPLSSRGATKEERDKLVDAYRTKIYILRDSKVKRIMDDVMGPDAENMKEVKAADAALALIDKGVADGTIDLNNPDAVTGNDGICDKLNDGYNAIRKNKAFVTFNSKSDEALYTADNAVTKVKRMVSVFDVWKDYLKGEYAGHGFIFWIIISVLVDLAAFLFFDLAFRREEF